MFLGFFKSIWPVGAINDKNTIKPVGKVFHWASDCDTDDELLAEPELELELDVVVVVVVPCEISTVGLSGCGLTGGSTLGLENELDEDPVAGELDEDDITILDMQS